MLKCRLSLGVKGSWLRPQTPPALLLIPTAHKRTAGISQMNKPQVPHSLIKSKVRSQQDDLGQVTSPMGLTCCIPKLGEDQTTFATSPIPQASPRAHLGDTPQPNFWCQGWEASLALGWQGARPHRSGKQDPHLFCKAGWAGHPERNRYSWAGSGHSHLLSLSMHSAGTLPQNLPAHAHAHMHMEPQGPYRSPLTFLPNSPQTSSATACCPPA